MEDYKSINEIIMKILIVAHVDDEIIWFNPADFDRIYIAFLNRQDKPEMTKNRMSSMELHHYKDKITLLNIDESGYWKNSNRFEEHKMAESLLHEALVDIKNNNKISMLFTHNERGEYGHSDHILVHHCVNTIFKDCCEIWMPCKFMSFDSERDMSNTDIINVSMDIAMFENIKKIYIEKNAWTWDLNYMPNQTEAYYRITKL